MYSWFMLWNEFGCPKQFIYSFTLRSVRRGHLVTYMQMCFTLKLYPNSESNSGLPSLTQSAWDICSWHSSHANISASFSSHSFILFQVETSWSAKRKETSRLCTVYECRDHLHFKWKACSNNILQCTFWMVRLAFKKALSDSFHRCL